MAKSRKKIETDYEIDLDWQGEPALKIKYSSGGVDGMMTVEDLLTENGLPLGYFDFNEIPALILWLDEIYRARTGKSAIKEPDNGNNKD